MTDNFFKMLDEISLTHNGDGEAMIQQLLALGIKDRESAIGIIEIHHLQKLSTWSRTKLFFRLLGRKDDFVVYGMLQDYLVASRHYNSRKQVVVAIWEWKIKYKKLRLEENIPPDASYELSNSLRRSILALMHLHFGDFPDVLQGRIVRIFGKKALLNAVDNRAKAFLSRVGIR